MIPSLKILYIVGSVSTLQSIIAINETSKCIVLVPIEECADNFPCAEIKYDTLGISTAALTVPVMDGTGGKYTIFIDKFYKDSKIEYIYFFHEIGHVFGLEHSKKVNNIMYYKPDTALTAVQVSQQLEKSLCQGSFVQ